MNPTEAHSRAQIAGSGASGEVTWAVYVTLLAILALAEALIKPEIGVDKVLDAAIVWTAFLGGVVAWVLSARFVLKGANRQKAGMLWRRIGAGWFLGPILAFAVVLGINEIFDGDIDGGLLLFYLPALAVLLPVIVLPVVMFVWVRSQD